MKKQFLALFAFVAILTMSSCLKQDIDIIIQEPTIIQKRINLFDSIIVPGKDNNGMRIDKKTRVEIKADVELNKLTGELKAKLLTPVPLGGWNIGYTLYKGDKALSNHTYKKINIDSVRFKVFAFPSPSDKGEYKLEVEVGAYSSILKTKSYKEEFKFKID